MNTITQERLKELTYYDPLTGIFTSRRTNNGGLVEGEELGYITGGIRKGTSNQYVCFMLDNQTYKRSRLAFLYVHGYMPKIVDHINGNKLDDRIANLRECSANSNAWNYPRPNTNTSGTKGLYLRAGKGFQVRVMWHKKSYTKYFLIKHFNNCWETTRLAAENYLQELRQQLHGEYANHG
jgi:hypothetical protein